MFTPAKIQKMWKRVNDRFGLDKDQLKPKGKEKKVSDKARQAEKEDARVTKNLIGLRALGQVDLSKSASAKRFVKSRDKAAKSMKKYCKLLKGDYLKDSVQDLPKFRKAVKQLLVIVESLEVRAYPDEAEGGEPDLNALEKVDTSALDKAMEDPKFGEISDAELDQEDTEEEAAEAAPETKDGDPGSIPLKAPPKPAPDIRPLRFRQQLQQLMPKYQQAIQAGASNRGVLETTMKLATDAATAKDFEKGLRHLATLDNELNKAGGAPSTPGDQPAIDGDPAAEFKAKLAEWTPAIKAAMAAKGPNAAAIAKLLAQATALSKAGGDMAQALAKLTECHAVTMGGSVPVEAGEDPGEVFKQRVQAFRPAFNTALTEARASNPDLAEELDGYFAQMFDEAKAKDFATALQTLDVLTKLVASAAGAKSPGGEQAAVQARLNKLLPEINKAKDQNTPTGQEIKVRLSELQLLLRKNEFGPADAVLTKIENLLKQESQGAAPGLAAWQTALKQVTSQLKALAGRVAASKDPESKGALMEINIILNKLIPNPVTADQVALMQSFLKDNQVVADLCDLAFDIRTPLLRPLAQLAPQLAG
jgi:hypothetical protein